MPNPTITIRGKRYPKPSIDRMKRGQVKQLKPLTDRLGQDEDLDALWELVAVMVPKLPEETLDDLDIGECKSILSAAGVAQFTGPDAADADADITVGESSASTSS